MSKLVIDASVAIKWVVDEPGTDEACSLLRAGRLVAPDLLIAECANILWKKVRRDELLADEAALAARLIQGADIEILPTRHLLEKAVSLAMALDHPAYGCLYLALALDNGWRFVTADDQFRRMLYQTDAVVVTEDLVLSLPQAMSNAC